jgi:uncharacterized protein with gpF-like domain
MPPKGKPPQFSAAKRLQRAYERGIKAVTGRVVAPVKPGQTFAQWLAEIAARANRDDVRAASEELARRMVAQVEAKNARTWREAAARSSQSRLLHKLLQREMEGPTGARVQSLIRENAALISSVPLHAARQLVDEVTKAQQAGARPGTIGKMAKARFPQLLRSRTNLISRTETAKASTALTQARCAELALDWYIWETALDGDRVRESHRKMHGVVVPWSQPPAPEALVGEKSTLGHYHVGECPNCRCTSIVVLTLDDIKFPARVYWNGAIRSMTKQDFKKIAVGLEERTTA